MNKRLLFLLVSTCFVALFSCSKEYSLEKGNQLPAEGSLWDSIGNCFQINVHGTYYNGVTPGQDTAYVEVQVNVSQTGSYKIETDGQNGFSFADSGFFTTTGLNTVRLKPLGVPIIPTTSTFSVSFDSTACSFVVVTQDSTGTGLGGGGDTTGNSDNAWQFTTTTRTFTGTFDTADIITDDNIWQTGGQMLAMEGLKTNSEDTTLALYIYLPTGAITTGSYSTQSLPPDNASLFGFIDFSTDPDNGTPIYASFPADSANNVVVNITSFDNTTRIVKGTFSGKTKDANDQTIDLSNGTFSAKVAP